MTIANKVQVQEYVYDFSTDGGTVGAKALHAKDNKTFIPTGAIIKAVTAKVVTPLAGAGAVLSWGNGNAADGYSGTAQAVAGFTDNALFNGWDNAASLLWDDTNDHPIPLYVDASAAGQFNFTIGTAVLTAGKIVFMVEFLMPTEI
jgi:hypothetical protein